MKAWTGELNQVNLPEGKVQPSDASVRAHPAGASPDGVTRATKRISSPMGTVPMAFGEAAVTGIAEKLQPAQSTPEGVDGGNRDKETHDMCASGIRGSAGNRDNEMPTVVGEPVAPGPTFHRQGFSP